MSSKKPLKYRELLKRLKPYGVIDVPARGRGSERILIRPNKPGVMKGPQYPVKCHGPGTEISIPVLKAILRRFNIPPSEFWD